MTPLVVGLLTSLTHPFAAEPRGGGTLTLTLSRQPAADEMVVLRLTVGVLTSITQIIVRTDDGEIAGTVTPYGGQPGRKLGVFTIPVPRKAVSGRSVTLRLEAVEKGAEVTRRPTRAEVEGLQVDLIRVSALEE